MKGKEKSMLKIEYKNIEEIKKYKRNSRTHSDEQIEQIVNSIKEFGFTNPLLIDENNEIIAGHGRYEAALKLKMDKVPCIVLRGLTNLQKKAYVIADNKLALNASWDLNLLSEELEELKENDFDLSLIGFDDDELDGFFSDNEDIQENDYEDIELKEPKVKLHVCPHCGCEFED